MKSLITVAYTHSKTVLIIKLKFGMEELKWNKGEFICLFKDDNMKLSIVLKNKAAKLIKNPKKYTGSYNTQETCISKVSNSKITITIRIPVKKLSTYNHLNGILEIENDVSFPIHFSGEILITKKEIEALSILAKEKLCDRAKSRRDREGKRAEYDRMTGAHLLDLNSTDLVEKMNKLEASHQVVSDPKNHFQTKGIYVANPYFYKRCENCANLTSGQVCSIHQVEVSENNACQRFYSYKTYLGGSFSSK